MASKLYHVKLRLSKPGFKSKTISGFVMGEKCDGEKAVELARKRAEEKAFKSYGLDFDVKVIDVNRVSFDFILNGDNKE